MGVSGRAGGWSERVQAIRARGKRGNGGERERVKTSERQRRTHEIFKLSTMAADLDRGVIQCRERHAMLSVLCPHGVEFFHWNLFKDDIFVEFPGSHRRLLLLLLRVVVVPDGELLRRGLLDKDLVLQSNPGGRGKWVVAAANRRGGAKKR